MKYELRGKKYEVYMFKKYVDGKKGMNYEIFIYL